MFYIIALLVLIVAILIVYLVRVVKRFRVAHAHRVAQCAYDPENPSSVRPDPLAPAPTLRETARYVSQAMFPRREPEPDTGDMRAGEPGYANRRSYGSAVTRVDSVQDGQLPSYQDSAKMPRVPAPTYDPAAAAPPISPNGTAVHTNGDHPVNQPAQTTSPAPSVPSVAPPQYSESPIVRRL